MTEVEEAERLMEQYDNELDELEMELDYMEADGHDEAELEVQRDIVRREQAKKRWNKVRKQKGAIGEMLVAAQVHFGAMKATAANKQACRRFLLRELPKHNVRKSDQVHVMETVMAAVFIPSRDMIRSARAIRSDIATLKRMEACYEDPRDSHGTSNLSQTQPK
jgi:hypothetical protein